MQGVLQHRTSLVVVVVVVFVFVVIVVVVVVFVFVFSTTTHDVSSHSTLIELFLCVPGDFCRFQGICL